MSKTEIDKFVLFFQNFDQSKDKEKQKKDKGKKLDF